MGKEGSIYSIASDVAIFNTWVLKSTRASKLACTQFGLHVMMWWFTKLMPSVNFLKVYLLYKEITWLWWGDLQHVAVENSHVLVWMFTLTYAIFFSDNLLLYGRNHVIMGIFPIKAVTLVLCSLLWGRGGDLSVSVMPPVPPLPYLFDNYFLSTPIRGSGIFFAISCWRSLEDGLTVIPIPYWEENNQKTRYAISNLQPPSPWIRM